jgi:hypothetical protein
LTAFFHIGTLKRIRFFRDALDSQHLFSDPETREQRAQIDRRPFTAIGQQRGGHVPLLIDAPTDDRSTHGKFMPELCRGYDQ